MNLFLVMVLAWFLPGATAIEADVVIRGATLYDGSSAPGQKGDLAIRGDRIVAVGSFETAGKPRIIDGAGLIVAPGFIDLHTHSDYPLEKPETRANLCYLTQGATTVVTGNCGSGPYEVGRFLKQLENGGIGSNVIHQVPHNDVRRAVMGNVDRLPTAEELKKMEALVDKGMKEGAWGLSTGLIYNPGAYARTEELIDLARIAARHNGFYASHIRDEGPLALEAIAEAIRIGQEAKLPVHISHLKSFGPKNWGRAADEIRLIEDARGKGQVVTADQYPYTASSTSLAADLIPPQFRSGTLSDFKARLSDPEQGPRMRAAIEQRINDLKAGKNLRIARCTFKPSWQGKDLQTIADQEKKSLVDLALYIELSGGAQIVNFSMSPEDVRLVMTQKFVATGSDGSSQVPNETVPHPRSYGTFPRKIGLYAIQDKIISVEHAIRSASGLPADILRLTDRGYLKPGYYADVVVFDPSTFRDKATFEKPHQFSTGVQYLFVNGKLAIDKGKFTGAKAGKALRHAS
jgi:N-acyl-D-aspartate/D-glutamate deacylase